KKGGGGKLASTVLFILIFLLSISTIVTIQIRSGKQKEDDMQQSASTAATDYEYEYERYESEASKPAATPTIEQKHSEAKQPARNEELTEQTEEKEETEQTEQAVQAEPKLTYIMPADGSVVKKFSESELVYSKTMDDWRQHFGVDITCGAGEAVKSMADGTVYEIYDDIEYGSTIIISHSNGIMTKYSNIDINEDIVKDAQVKCGQALGVVSQNPPCEIAEDTHLHLEAVKDNVRIDPISIIK
ncbi:MAG: M23 family metallopeptidase, partial [Clostridia bacterium]|nr:M23 family metallopeptidase [Clostridia bacterium]